MSEEFNQLVQRKHEYLWDALFNELYIDHPELWPWIKEKLEEYERIK